MSPLSWTFGNMSTPSLRSTQLGRRLSTIVLMRHYARSVYLRAYAPLHSRRSSAFFWPSGTELLVLRVLPLQYVSFHSQEPRER